MVGLDGASGWCERMVRADGASGVVPAAAVAAPCSQGRGGEQPPYLAQPHWSQWRSASQTPANTSAVHEMLMPAVNTVHEMLMPADADASVEMTHEAQRKEHKAKSGCCMR